MPHPLLLPLRKSYFFRRAFFLLARSAMTYFLASFLAFFMVF